MCGGGINLSIIKIPEDDDTLNHAYFYVVVELVVDVLKNEDKKRTHLFQKYQFKYVIDLSFINGFRSYVTVIALRFIS